MVVNEIITKFGFEGSTQPLSNYNNALDEAIKLSAMVVAGITAAAGSIYYFTTSTLESTDALNQLARETNTNIEQLQELGYIATVNGSSMGDVEQSVSSLTEALGRAANGEKMYGQIFKDLGIDIRDAKGAIKDATTMLYDLNKAFRDKNLSKQEQAGYIKKLRLNKRMIQMLGLEGSEMDKLSKKARALGIVTKEQADATSDMFDAITTAKFVIDGLSNTIALSFMPKITEIANAFTDWKIANNELITDGLERTVRIIQATIGFVVDIGKAIFHAIDSTIGWGVAIGIVAARFIYLNKAMLLNPIFLMTTAIAGVILALQDLWVAFEGGDSLIAEYFKDAFNVDIRPYLKNIVKNVSESVGEIKTSLSNIWNTESWDTKGLLKNIGIVLINMSKMFVDTLGGLVGENNAFDKMTKHIRDSFKKSWEIILRSFNKVWEDITSYIPDFSNMLNTIKSFGDSIMNIFSRVGDWIKEKLTFDIALPEFVKDFMGDKKPVTVKVLNNTPDDYIRRMSGDSSIHNNTSNKTEIHVTNNISGSNASQIGAEVAKNINDFAATPNRRSR